MAEKERVIECKGVSKRFGDKQVLTEMDFYADKNEFVVILGPGPGENPAPHDSPLKPPTHATHCANRHLRTSTQEHRNRTSKHRPPVMFTLTGKK